MQENINKIIENFKEEEIKFAKTLEQGLKEFEKLRNDRVSSRELKRVKEYMKGTIILGLENTSSRMMRLAGNLINHGRFITVDEVVQRIDAISADDIFSMANEVLDDSMLTQMVLYSNNSHLNN